MNKIDLLDCTLRDGAYIVDAKFGMPAIKGIIKKMQDANAEIVECGWLKNSEHELGTTFYHVPGDLEHYLIEKKANCTYTVMIDWDRYDLDYLPMCDGNSVDAVRVVFPHGKAKEGVVVGKEIIKKGYKVFIQAANTLAYSEDDLIELAKEVNESNVETLSIVDTFGAMYHDDLERILEILDRELRLDVAIGFHSHNNQQLSFALTIHFIEWLSKNSTRKAVVDASLCGMGRGAGNATTELIANYLNMKKYGNYDMDLIMDAIDTYMQPFQENYTWGYSTPYFIAGMYCCHVNNIAYLIQNHRTNAKDMRNIIQSLSPEDRKKYDYDLLEQKYIENQNRIVDDNETIQQLKREFENKTILLIAPGKRVLTQKERVDKYIAENNPVIIQVNALAENYEADYLFLINNIRYEYAKNTYTEKFHNTPKILLSSVKNKGDLDEKVVSFSSVVKTGWEHFDNAVIYCLRLLDRIGVDKVAIAGFDEFSKEVKANYADKSLPVLEARLDYNELNKDICEMFGDFLQTSISKMQVEFVTDTEFAK
ncbi:MAG: aldolase catalytic domain-containing protein [Lachnospiraceae bacterium]|nr:aldolase catalytic domain-containing protein [Lachnospiraceae bacterium]